MKDTPTINVGLAPGELFIVPSPDSPMIALPAARYLARYEVLGRGEDWMACRVQEAALDSKPHKIVERIAVFPQREQAQAFVDHMTRLLMASEPQEQAPIERRVIRPGRGLMIMAGALVAIIVLVVAIYHLI